MKIYRYIALIVILCFSFYYAENIANYTLEKNDLYQEINNKKEIYSIKPVNAVVDNYYIIPGINGREVDVKKSYYRMKNVQAFNEVFLSYKVMQPDLSLNDYIDKVINRGNELKGSVAFVIDGNDKIINYFIKNNIPGAILVQINSFDKDCKLEQINNDVINFNKVDILLNKYRINTNICYLSDNIENICRKNHKYLVSSKIVVNNRNFINIKNNIASGDIYYINKNLSIDNLEILIKTIRFKDLHIVTLSRLIMEDKS